MDILSILNPFTPLIEKLVDRIPDPNKRAEAKEEIERMLVQAATDGMKGQMEVNAQEAQHHSVFVAGWRPFIGWTCGVAFAYSFVVQPLGVLLASVAAQATDWTFDPNQLPSLDMGPLMTVLMGMLGLGTLRTYEKLKGVARKA